MALILGVNGITHFGVIYTTISILHQGNGNRGVNYAEKCFISLVVGVNFINILW
jgi:hypothetical protein